MKPLDPRVLPHLAPARAPLAVVVAGSVLGAALLVGQALALATTVARLVADPLGAGWHLPAALFVAALLGRAALATVTDVAAARAAALVGVRLRDVVLAAVLARRPEDGAARRELGADGLLATRGVAAVEPYLTRYLPALVLAVVLPVITLLAIASLDWLSGLVVALTLPLLPVFAILIGMSTRERADRQWRVLAQLAGHFVDVVRGLPTLVVHRRARAQAPRIREATDRYRRANTDVLKLAFASSAALELIATISVALVAVAVGLRLAGGGLELQTALAVLLLAPEAYWPLRRVGAEFHAAAEGTATFEAIHDLTSGGPTPGGRAVDVALSGDLRIERLGVRRGERAEPVLDDLSVTIPRRGLTVVTGPSGCGKSTLLEALRGELDHDGTVLVGGTDLAGVDPAAWRRHVALVGQRPWLLDASVGANVRVGRPGADDAAVWDALRRVRLDAGVRAMPGGLDAPLGEDGDGLSAGQRARLALARVVLADRPYVFLDEPTAHLDATTEAVLVEVVRDLARTRCVVAVAHRPALVAAADHRIALPGRPGAGAPRRTAPVPAAPAVPTALAAPDAPEAPAPAAERVGLRWAGAVALGVLSSLCGVALTATAGWLIVRASEHPPVLMLMVAIVGVRAFGLGRPAFRYAERLVSHDVGLRELAERRARVYDVLVPLVPGRLGGRRRGDLLTSVVDDVDSLLDDRLRVRMPVVTAVGVLAVTVLLAAPVLPTVALVTVGVAAVAGLATWATARWGVAAGADRVVAARAAVARHALTTLDDARSLVAWQADGDACRAVRSAGTQLGRATTRAAVWAAVARAWPFVGAAVSVVLVARLGADALATGAVGAPVLALFLLLPLALVDVVSPLADAGVLGVTTRAARRRLDALEELEPPVAVPAAPAPLPVGPGATDVVLDGVAAAWEPGRTAVADLDLVVPPGTHVGLVGPSGCGKSTVAALLVRFLSPTAGTHRLGGVDATTLDPDDVRRRVGLVDDDPYLFASTVAENVRLARPSATDAEVREALVAARLDLWLAGLPEGLATRIGDGGAGVSGGERARIGLARALLADAAVLVLDEPTAHLDTATARAVTEDLLAACAGRSVVWITHDEIGLDRMDRVVTLGGAPAPAPARVG
ncbi:ATP-binding cassette subfamily C protein CydCD [Nocardioides zeae]|uniref:ATP-binding cassette subfamily C protein CydCD n=1 Tax=Nocardioides zeae TaxID=1457234 RepID=A0ACC6IFI5_9ACTN|nr:thiol reductant ABC exporter subunit CydD [Nocardioides zeae]MDR6176464.1 ATP-binding cassette subfamily C protein CydCD [Nocardioides zeae]MDR6209477.1 ATP-binding cassette subfamily C protein CydCD [Nocardioides zeae]